MSTKHWAPSFYTQHSHCHFYVLLCHNFFPYYNTFQFHRCHIRISSFARKGNNKKKSTITVHHSKKIKTLPFKKCVSFLRCIFYPHPTQNIPNNTKIIVFLLLFLSRCHMCEISRWTLTQCIISFLCNNRKFYCENWIESSTGWIIFISIQLVRIFCTFLYFMIIIIERCLLFISQQEVISA